MSAPAIIERQGTSLDGPVSQTTTEESRHLSSGDLDVSSTSLDDPPDVPVALPRENEHLRAPPPLPVEKIRLPSKETWPDYPLLFRNSGHCAATITDAEGNVQDPYAALPINDPNTPIFFETRLFKGRALFRIDDLPPNPRPGGRGGSAMAADYFEGRKRKMQVCVQGQFKERLSFDQVMS